MKKQTATIEVETRDALYLALLHEMREMHGQIEKMADTQQQMLHDEGLMLMDVTAIVARLSPAISEKTVRNWFRKEYLPNRNPGGSLMCSVSDLKSFIKGENNAKEKYSLTPKRGRRPKDK